MPSSPRVPVNPTPEPERQRERAKRYQLEAIAEMSVWGTPVGKMADITGLSESYISRLLTGSSRNETFNKLREDYKQRDRKNVMGPFTQS